MRIFLYNALQFGKEVFWKFYFFPIIGSLIGIIVCVFFNYYETWILFACLLLPFIIYNALFFVKFGEREKHFHQGDE